MMQKMIVNMVCLCVSATMYASTPVNQGSPFPEMPPNQTQEYRNAKRNNRPSRPQVEEPPVLVLGERIPYQHGG